MDWLFKNNPSVFNIEAGLSFVDCLAKVILKAKDDTPFSLNDTVILLPNHRSGRALKEAFLRLSDGKPILLPTIKAIGDIGDEDFGLRGGIDLNALEIPKAISPKHRQLLLTKLILKAAPGLGFNNLSLPQAIKLAHDLASLIDEVDTNEANWANLEDLVDKDLAHHWKQTLIFLEIITKYWPEELRELDLVDPSTRRRMLLNNYNKTLEKTPLKGPIIAAGSTGTIPATARLLKTISRLPRGAIVLPGLDMEMDETVWDDLAGDEGHSPSETHPQYTLKALLDHILVSRDEVAVWPQDEDDQKNLHSLKTRKTIITEALLPANAMGGWQKIKQRLQNQYHGEDTLKGMSVHVASGLREEASAIALMMREGLETPSKQIALITANTGLARRVEAELWRWNINVDKSAGTPLLKSPPTNFMALVAEAQTASFAPLPLLALLKHPFMALGYDRIKLLHLTRLLEKSTLRGPRPEHGLKGLLKTLKLQKNNGNLCKLIVDLQAAFKDFSDLYGGKTTSFSKLLEAHILLSERLATSPEENGLEILWSKDDGRALSSLLRELLDISPTLGPIDPGDYPLLFKRLIEGEVVRHSYGGHPRLSIWGTLEGRLQASNMVILGDLNEGSWPPSPGDDPWMSRPMRADFGLASLERRIGQSAHDFVQALGTDEVVLSRSEKIDGTPTVSSRWILRLEALLGELPTNKPWAKWQENLTKDDVPKPWGPPEPRPPTSSRPIKLSVTNVGLWMKDPYALFAKYILKLRPLDPIDQEPGAAQKGNQFHDALEHFTKGSDQSLEGLLNAGRKAFEKNITRPGVWAFWWPKFEQVAKAFVEIQQKRSKTHKIMAIESEGETLIKSGRHKLTLTAKADRIDEIMEDGSLEIIDYKTGSIPTLPQIEAGFAPQLPLEGIIAENGGFKNLNKKKVSSLKYWKISGGKKPIDIPPHQKLDVENEIKKAEMGLKKLIHEYSKKETPYLSNPDPEEKSYGDYNHLARVKEWLHDNPKNIKNKDGEKR